MFNIFNISTNSPDRQRKTTFEKPEKLFFEESNEGDNDIDNDNQTIGSY